MFGRKARQIANQAIMIATARTESHDHLSQIVDKNKKIIELGKALQEAHRQLEVERNELRQADQKVHRAESAADAAIQAAGIMGDQARAAQAALAEKETVIQQLLQSNTEKSRNLIALTAKVDRLAEALRQARAQLDSARLIDKAIETKTDTPALQALREEIAKVREGDVEVVYELPPLPKRTPGRKLQEQAAQDAAGTAEDASPQS